VTHRSKSRAPAQVKALPELKAVSVFADPYSDPG
jgi:hypothetical protein